MKIITKILLLFILVLPGQSILSQKLNTEISVSPLMTFMISKDTNNKISSGFSVSVNEYYNINEKLALGLGIIYSIGNYELTKDSEIHIYGSSYEYESEIKINSITFPILINYKIKKDWLIRTGFGFKIGGYSHKSYQRISMFGSNELNIETPNTRYNIEIGKYFKIGEINLVTTVSFSSTFQSYEYNHYGVEYYDNSFYEYKLKPTNLGLSIGVVL